jgi:hypothetical protein
MAQLIPEDLLNQMLPRAATWAQRQEGFILHHCEARALSPQEQIIARRADVQHPEAVRLLAVPEIALPDEEDLRDAAAAVGLITAGTAGLTIGHGIFVRQDCLNDSKLIAHELRHVAQFERHRSISAFLQQYLFEVNQYGYHDAPMEHEARAFAEAVTIRYEVVNFADQLEKVLLSIEDTQETALFRLWIKEFVQGLKESPELYRRPGGCVLLAFSGSRLVGYVGFRPLSSTECEMRCLIRRDSEWGKSVGRGLALELIKQASGAAYRSMKLFFFPDWKGKLAGFYKSLGFVPCDAFTDAKGAVFVELVLPGAHGAKPPEGSRRPAAH